MAVTCVNASVKASDGETGDPGGAALRSYIANQVGGLQKLQVPLQNGDLPVPREPVGTVRYRYETTEAKRYLGKMLFHDP